MMKQLIIAKIILISFFFVTNVLAETDIDQIPPEQAKKLYQVIDLLEDKGIKQILSIQFDDWIWKASSLDGHKKTYFYISPDSLVIFKKKNEYELDPVPPVEGKSIRDILAIVENTGYRNIRQIVFENFVWKVKTYSISDEEKKFIIDPLSGSILYKNAQTKRSKPYLIYGLVKAIYSP